MIIKSNEVREGELPVNKVILGDAFEVLKKLPDNSVDAVVTDPPYGLKFMNKKWDYDVPSVELWKEVLRVLKPGGHLLSFFGTRTYHRGVVNIEDAGFEIRDMIQWLYGGGFPKSMDISKAIDKEFGKLEEREVIGFGKGHTGIKVKNHLGNFDDDNYEWRGQYRITVPATLEAKKWQGWGTALKPACEPIVLARKPISEKNIAQNMLKWGTGGLNIDECRIEYNGEVKTTSRKSTYTDFAKKVGGSAGYKRPSKYATPTEKGRFPANVILDEEVAKMMDKQSGVSKSNPHPRTNSSETVTVYGKYNKVTTGEYYNDIGGASRFFYVAKASRDERFAYCHDCGEVIPQKAWQEHKNHNVEFHPTVKPLKLIEYLVRLITPPDGIVLDPFLGTGTTAIAALRQGFRFIGIELYEPYVKIAVHRLKPYLAQQRLDVWSLELIGGC